MSDSSQVSQLSQSQQSDIVGSTCNTLGQRGTMLHGDTVPCPIRPSAHRVHTTWMDKVSPSPLPHLITDPSLAHRGIHVTAHTESMRFVRHSCRFLSCGLCVRSALMSKVASSGPTFTRVVCTCWSNGYLSQPESCAKRVY